MAASHVRALAAAARSRRGHEPWLFYPRDGHWRWWSFERGWTEVERWRAVLERGEGPAAGDIPAPESSPEALCCHVAARAGDAGEAIAAFDRLLTGGASAREIVVVAPPARAETATPTPADRLARLWLDWCCTNLAVLALEPSRAALVGSVLWCRPTAMLVDAEQERSLAAAVVERSGGRDRRAAGLLDRLRLLLVVADDGAGDGDDDGEFEPPEALHGTGRQSEPLRGASTWPPPAAAGEDAGAPSGRPVPCATAQPDGCERCWRAWGVERRLVGEGGIRR